LELARSKSELELVHSKSELELVRSSLVLVLARSRLELELHNQRPSSHAIWRVDRRLHNHPLHEALQKDHRRNRLGLQLQIRDLRLPMRWQASSTYYDSSRHS
jgi:hypothetical protein